MVEWVYCKYTALHRKDAIMSDSYKSMVTSGASPAEIQAHLADGDAVAVTVRIPSNLKEAATEYAAMSGMSFSALFHNCLINELSAKGK